MAFSFLALAPIMMLPAFRGLHMATLQKQWKGMLFIGAFLALNIALNNISLVEISLSLNQVIRLVQAVHDTHERKCKPHLYEQGILKANRQSFNASVIPTGLQ